MSFNGDVRISFLTQILKWNLNEIQIEHSICLLMLEVLFFMCFINVEVSFIYAGVWFTCYVTPCMLAVFYPNHSLHPLLSAKSSSFLQVPHFMHNLSSEMLMLVPSQPTTVLTPHGQNVIAILREKQAYFGRKIYYFRCVILI